MTPQQRRILVMTAGSLRTLRKLGELDAHGGLSLVLPADLLDQADQLAARLEALVPRPMGGEEPNA